MFPDDLSEESIDSPAVTHSKWGESLCSCDFVVSLSCPTMAEVKGCSKQNSAQISGACVPLFTVARSNYCEPYYLCLAA